jgi:Na+/H+ antiporter NhaD/arsenite permease-like protein
VGSLCAERRGKHDETVSRPDRAGTAIRVVATGALLLALAVHGLPQVVGSFDETWRAFALVGAVIVAGWVGVRIGVFERAGSRIVRSAASRVFAGVAILVWVFVLSGLTNLDVAVVAATPLALLIAADRGLDGGLVALSVAQVANAGSILLPTANITTLLVLGPAVGSDASYLRQAWLAWLLVGAVTLAVLGPLASRAGRTPTTVGTDWSLARIGLDLVGMFVLASSLRALVPTGITIGTGYWSAAVGASTLAAAVNNLPAAAAVHVTSPAAAWGAVAGLAIGPNLLLTGSVASVIVRRMAREGGVEMNLRTFTLVGFVLVPAQLGAAFVGLRLVGALRG